MRLLATLLLVLVPALAGAEGTTTSSAAPMIVVAESAPPPAPKVSEGSVLSSPLFWVIVSAVAVAGAATGLTIALSGEKDPYAGTAGVILGGP